MGEVVVALATFEYVFSICYLFVVLFTTMHIQYIEYTVMMAMMGDGRWVVRF